MEGMACRELGDVVLSWSPEEIQDDNLFADKVSVSLLGLNPLRLPLPFFLLLSLSCCIQMVSSGVGFNELSSLSLVSCSLSFIYSLLYGSVLFVLFRDRMEVSANYCFFFIFFLLWIYISDGLVIGYYNVGDKNRRILRF